MRYVLQDAAVRVSAAALRPQWGWVAAASAVALTLLGITAIQTVSPVYATRQQQWLWIAAGSLVVALTPRPRTVARCAYAGFAVCLLLLLLLLLPGVPDRLTPRIKGVRQWIDLGFMNFQPSEAAKVFAVLSLAWYLRFRDSHRTLLGLCVPFAIMLVPVALILQQPDLGMSLLYAPTLFAMLVAAGAKLRHLGGLVAIAAGVAVLNVALILGGPDWAQVLRPHQVNRIRSMAALATGDDRFNQTTAYQQREAMTLVSAGGGSGLGGALAHEVLQTRPLPEAHNDMIFAVVVHRWGARGGTIVLLLYAGLVLGCLAVAARSRDPVGRLACVGFATLYATQAGIVTAMTVGLLPITGLTLPFMSYGGSSLLVNYLTLGLVLNFGAAEPRRLARPSFEFDARATLYQ